MEDKELFEIKQKVMRHINAHETLINFLKEGTVILDILTEIIQNPMEKLIYYREDVFLKICELFTLCNVNLMYFCKNNQSNQKLIHKHLNIFMQFDIIDFKQVELIYEIYNGNDELTATIDNDLIRYFFKLVKLNGKCPFFLKILIEVTKAENEPSRSLRSMIIEKLLKSSQNII